MINNVILRKRDASTAALILSALFALVFIGLTVAAVIAAKPGPGLTVLLPLLCAALFAMRVYAAAPLRPQSYEHPFKNRIEETKGLSSVSPEPKLIVNLDDSHWWGFFNDLAEKGTFDDASMNAYVEQYADSGVTDLMFNIFCQSSDVPSDVFTFRGDLYGDTEQNGEPVDYSPYRGLNEIYNVQKKDIFAVWFDRCRELGLRPWISIRMNDCHDPDKTTSLLRGDFFYTARENGWMLGDEYGYYKNCLNYAVPEVRQKMLDYIKEQLSRCDVYGLELDFMREIYCFDYLHADNAEIREIMNGFIRDVRAILQEAGTRRGHAVRLAVRMMRDPDQCRAFGFDPETWCEEGLIDAVTVTPRFSSNDSAMPIAEWISRCKNTEIWAGIETLVNRQAEGSAATAEVARGYAAQYLTAGAHGVYLFNYMSAGEVGPREREVYDTCGDVQTILGLPRRHIVTYQDTVPEGWEPYAPLPLRVKKNRPAALEVETGYIPSGAAVSVLIGTQKPLGDAPALTVKLGEQTCVFAGPAEAPGLSEETGEAVPGGYAPDGAYIYCFTVPDTTALTNLQRLTFSGETAKLVYAEIDVSPIERRLP